MENHKASKEAEAMAGTDIPVVVKSQAGPAPMPNLHTPPIAGRNRNILKRAALGVAAATTVGLIATDRVLRAEVEKTQETAGHIISATGEMAGNVASEGTAVLKEGRKIVMSVAGVKDVEQSAAEQDALRQETIKRLSAVLNNAIDKNFKPEAAEELRKKIERDPVRFDISGDGRSKQLSVLKRDPDIPDATIIELALRERTSTNGDTITIFSSVYPINPSKDNNTAQLTNLASRILTERVASVFPLVDQGIEVGTQSGNRVLIKSSPGSKSAVVSMSVNSKGNNRSHLIHDDWILKEL